MGAPAFDWLDYYRRSVDRQHADALAQMAAARTARPPGGPTQPLDRYAGLYRDPWYGDMRITRKGKTLSIALLKSPAMKGPLEVWGPDVFRTRFPDRREEDVFITFKVENGAPVSATMKAVSPVAWRMVAAFALAETSAVGWPDSRVASR